MPRTEPVTWGEMVANPRAGGMRILENQIADRNTEIERLRTALTELVDQQGSGSIKLESWDKARLALRPYQQRSATEK